MQDFLSSRRAFLRHGTALAALAALGATRSATAQTAAPSSPAPAAASASGVVRVLCTGPAGSIPDIVARRYAEQFAGLGMGSAVVDNRAGAAGQIAVGALKQADPDGATMLLAQGAVATVYPWLYAKLPYDPIADLKPVSLAAAATLGLAVGPAVPATVTGVREFVEWMRANPQLANYGSPGTGTLPHLLSALLAREAKADWQHVTYAGGPPALIDLMGGRIAAMSLPEGLLRQHHAAGKLRVIATSGTARSTFMPSVPTFVEQGYPTLVMREWFAFFMPGATPQPLIDAAAQRIRQAATGSAVSGALADMGMLAAGSTPGELRERIATEQRHWQGVFAATGIRAE